jgi:hypothetical protein
MYLVEGKKCASAMMTATHATVKELTAKIENVGQKFFIDNLFSSPALNDDLHKKTINCCGDVRPNKKGIPMVFGKKLKMRQAGIKTKVMDDLTAIVYKDN